MSALVESMFSVRQMPWHREGVILDEYPGSWAQARIPAGLEWEPIEAPVYRVLSRNTREVPVLELYGMDGDEPIYKQVGTEVIEIPRVEENKAHKHIVRSDNGNILAVNSKGYTIIDNTEMGEIFESVLGASTNIKYETAGSLDGGKMTWALAMLDEPIELPGDTSATYPYLALTTRHDGTAGCTLRATAVRIVCANTFNAAEMEGQRHGATFSFRHSANWKDRIEDARAAVTGARKQMKAYSELATELLGIPFSAPQRELFVTAFIPTPPAGAVTERVMANTVEAQERLRKLFASETTINIAHTAYGAVQAAGEYLDHVRGARSWETRLGRTLIKPEPLKRKALTLVREIVAAGV